MTSNRLSFMKKTTLALSALTTPSVETLKMPMEKSYKILFK
jgi:hypothetical protein